MHGGNYPEDCTKKSNPKPILFNNVEQTARVLLIPRVFGGICPFFDYETARGEPPR